MALSRMNFKELTDAARRKGVPLDQRPQTMSWLARTTGVSVPHLYNLINGTKIAQPWTVQRLADKLGHSTKTVEKSLALSRKQAGHG